MKKILLLICIAVGMASCKEPCEAGVYEFEIGDDVHIKNKTFHNDAVVTKQLQNEDDCSCSYEIAYFAALGVRRHRVVTPGEIE